MIQYTNLFESNFKQIGLGIQYYNQMTVVGAISFAEQSPRDTNFYFKSVNFFSKSPLIKEQSVLCM